MNQDYDDFIISPFELFYSFVFTLSAIFMCIIIPFIGFRTIKRLYEKDYKNYKNNYGSELELVNLV